MLPLRLRHTARLLALARDTRRMSSTKHASGPINLVTVNTFPDRAKTVVGKVLANVGDRYDIVHAGNADSIDGVKPLLESIHPPPGILFCASMWTPEEQVRIQEIAKATIPGIKTHAAPPGLQAQAGVEGVVKHLSERIDEIMQAK